MKNSQEEEREQIIKEKGRRHPSKHPNKQTQPKVKRGRQQTAPCG
jgi:hypothetical protein